MKAGIDFRSYASARIADYENLKSFKVDGEKIIKPIVITKDMLMSIQNDFKQELKRRSEDKKLTRIEAKALKDKLLKKYPVLDLLHKHNSPGIYWFSISTPSLEFNKEVYGLVKDFRVRTKKWFSQVENARFSKITNTLYLGKVQSQLLNRFVQHIGLGHKSTTSLQLVHWAKDLTNFEFEYCFLPVDKKYLHLLDDIEAVLWNDKLPLLGLGKKITKA